MDLSDLDTPASISRFVDGFYARITVDPLLAPLFFEHAEVDLEVHLPRIKAYWEKMLLGDDSYRRHMMRKHREVHRRHPFGDAHYARWVKTFEETLDQGYRGPFAERARTLARRVAGNMRRNLESASDHI